MPEKKFLFISDLHLCSDRPDKLALFKSIMAGPARSVDALYILGDLFEAWAGDDDITPPHPEVIAILNSYTQSGGNLYVMRGNRDYLLSDEFSKETGAQMLADKEVIDINGTPVLLMHGDTLCTLDIMYQVFRCIVNNPVSIKFFMALPYAVRIKIWHGVRNLISENKYNKSPEIVDVHQPAVEKVMKKNNVTVLIHGHTHKQAIHEFTLDNMPARRYVLGDWYEKDCVLIADGNGFVMMAVQAWLDNAS